MEASIRAARSSDVPAIHRLSRDAADALTRDFGPGHWSKVTTRKTLRKAVDLGSLYVVEADGQVAGTFRLSSTKIPFYRKSWFARPDDPAAYLRDMAIDPAHQRKGLGRAAMAAMERRARAEGLRAIRLDAYDAGAGAGAFYRKCGYTLVHQGNIGATALEYYEKVLGDGPLQDQA